MVESPWVVIDAVKQEMRCERCGQTEPLSILTGKRLDFAAGIMRAFAQVHARCEERVTI